MGEARGNGFHAPDGAALIQGALLTDEGGRGAALHPDMVVGRLLADHGCDYAFEAAELDVDGVVGCFSVQLTDGEGRVVCRFDEEMDEPRLVTGDDVGDLRRGDRGEDTEQKVGGKAV